MNTEQLISKLCFTQIFCMGKLWSDALLMFLADLDNTYRIKLLLCSIRYSPWKSNSPGNHSDDRYVSICSLLINTIWIKASNAKYHLNQHGHIANWFILRHCSFFLISSNLTFGKSGINYVSIPNERRKKIVYDFKVSLARLWHGTLQRERKITLHTWSIKKKKKAFEMDCWVESSLAQVMALMAQPLGAGILGLDKTVAGPVSVGTGPSSGSS